MRQAAHTSLTDETRAFARSLGFQRVGIADARAPLDVDHAHYQAFVDAGMHGTMDWLARHGDARRSLDGDAILAGARSVVVCALAHRRDDDAGDDVAGARIARYARGADYHNFMRRRLRALAAWLRRRVPGTGARPMVDTAPVLERAWARRAGIGFAGKNGLVIAPGLGSYVLLGEVATTLALEPDAPMESRCGACTACLDACPTQAFARPFVLDARRCVAYLTIELQGPMPVAMRAPVGDRLFGCDDCQDVCPYNRTAAEPPPTTARFAPDARRRGLTLADLVALDDAAFAALTAGTPLARAGREGLARNALVVMGNARDRRYVPVLERVASDAGASDALRETARWAIERIAHAPGGDDTRADPRDRAR